MSAKWIWANKKIKKQRRSHFTIAAAAKFDSQAHNNCADDSECKRDGKTNIVAHEPTDIYSNKKRRVKGGQKPDQPIKPQT